MLFKSSVGSVDSALTEEVQALKEMRDGAKAAGEYLSLFLI